MDPLTPLQDPEPALQVDAFDAPAQIEVEVQPPPQQRPKLSRKEAGDLAVQEWVRARLGRPKTAGEVFSDVGRNLSTLVPFLSSGQEAYHLYDLWDAAQTPDEQRTTAQNDLLTAAAVEQGRDSTWGAKFADIVTQLPAFAGEFALTGGVYSLARKGAAKGMEKALGKTLTRLAGAKASELAVKGASVLAGATAQTIAMPTQVVNATLRAALPRIGISKDESGEIATVLEGSTRGFLDALPAGFSDALTETVSERTGGLVEMGTDALLKIRGLQLASIRRWVQSGNGRTWSDAAKKIKESTGWNGILGEFSEERIGAAMRAANPLLPDTWGQVWPGWEQASAELAAFAVPGAASRIAEKVLGRAKPAAATDGAPVATPAGAGPVVPLDGSSDLPVGSNEVPGAGPALPTVEPVEGSSDAGETSAVRPVPPPAWSEMPDLEGEPAPDAVEPDDDGQRAAAVLVRANRDRGYLEESDLQGARLVEPTNPLDVWGKEFLQVPMVMVDAGKPMRMSAVYTNGALALDARAAPAERVKAILFHELAHVTRATRRSSWQRWHADLSAVDPEGMRLAEEEYASEFKTTAGRSLGPDARVDEGAARYVESIVGYLDLTLRDRQRAVRIATKNPGVFRSIIDGVRRLVNRLFETNIPLEVEKQARAWLAEADALVPGSQRGRATSERAAALSPEQAARIALRTVEMFDSLAGPRRVATAPAGPINPSSGGGSQQARPASPAPGEGPAAPVGIPEQEASAAAEGGESVVAEPPPVASSEVGKEDEAPKPKPTKVAPSAPLDAPKPKKGRIVPRRTADGGVEYVAEPIPESEVVHDDAERRERYRNVVMDSLQHGREPIRGIAGLRKLWAQANPNAEALGDKDIEEEAEAAAVLRVREVIRRARGYGMDDKLIYDLIRGIEKRMPALKERTSEQREFQAYSTPLPIAFVASRLAKVTDQDRVLEPTAGHGALLIEANRAKALANEIQEGRRQRLSAAGFHVLGYDAVSMTFPGEYDVVMTNPPFGRQGGITLDHEIPLRALDKLKKDDGRAVLIIASGGADGLGRIIADPTKRASSYAEGATRRFFQKLYTEWNVVEHFTVDGSLYEKQGAAWPVDVIVIDGKGPSALGKPFLVAPATIESHEALAAYLDPDRGVRAPGNRPEGRVGDGASGNEADAPGVRGQADREGDDAPVAHGRGGSGNLHPKRKRGHATGPAPKGGSDVDRVPADGGDASVRSSDVGGGEGQGVAGGRADDVERAEPAQPDEPAGVGVQTDLAGLADLANDLIDELYAGGEAKAAPPTEPARPPITPKKLEPKPKPPGLSDADAQIKAELDDLFAIEPPDSPRFRMWFRGSKVTEPDGKPLVVYHGTRTPGFTEFSLESRGTRTGANSARKGFFFSDSAGVAGTYALRDVPPVHGIFGETTLIEALELKEQRLEAQVERLEGGAGGKVEEEEDSDGETVFTFTISEWDIYGELFSYGDNYLYDTYEEAKDALHEFTGEETEKRREQWAKATEARVAKDRDLWDRRFEGGATVPAWLSIVNPLVHDYEGGDYTDKSFSELVDEALEDGHDGVIMENVMDANAEGYAPSNVYVVFRSTQIKSAIGNRGRFSRQNESHLFAVEPMDEAKYARASATFEKAIAAKVSAEEKDPRTILVQVITYFRDVLKVAKEKIKSLVPYLQRFVSERLERAQEKPAEIVRVEAVARDTQRKVHGEHQIVYSPASKGTSVGSLMPKNMYDAFQVAIERLERNVGPVDEFVAQKLGYTVAKIVGTKDKRGLFSAEQIDALALAIDAIDKGKGFIIGDQTGVGKGRVVAGILRYARRSGKIPLFMTEKPTLYADMHRDLFDIEVTDLSVLVTNSDLRGRKAIALPENPETGATLHLSTPNKAQHTLALSSMVESKQLPKGYSALFTTYSQFSPIRGGATLRHNAVSAVSPNAIFILDESHNAVGQEAEPEEGKFTRAGFIRGMVARAHAAVFSSATFAKNPFAMTLYANTDMQLALPGETVGARMDALRGAMERGGVPLQQIVSNMLAQAGQYIRRERSYQGVEFAERVITVNRANADMVAEQLGDLSSMDQQLVWVRDAMGQQLLAAGGKLQHLISQGFAAADVPEFASVMHNVANQSLLALKAEEAAHLAVEAFKRGEKPVLTVSNTLEAVLSEWARDEGKKSGDSAAELHMGHLLRRYLKNMRTLGFRDERDKWHRYFITDADLIEIGMGHLVVEFDRLLEKVQKIDTGLPISPIDRMIRILEDAGIRVGEVTGRQLLLDDRTKTLQTRKAGPAESRKTIDAFQAGKLDAIILNRSGSTGVSLHAHPKADGGNPKPRHMIIVQPEPSIETFAQVLGRIHRTGQVHLPRFTYLVANMPAELRIAARVKKKLAGMNANVTSNAKSDVNVGSLDYLNKYGDEVAADYLDLDRVTAARLNLAEVRDQDGDVDEDTAAKLTGRMAALPVAKQEEIVAFIENGYRDLIATLDAMGTNDLEAKTLALDAVEIDREELTLGDAQNESPFAAASFVGTFDVKRLTKSLTYEEAQERVDREATGQTFEEGLGIGTPSG